MSKGFIYVCMLLFVPHIPQNNPAVNSPYQAIAQENVVSQAESSDSSEEGTTLSGIKTFWKLTEKGGQIRWAIIVVLVIGIFVIMMKIIELVYDRIKSKKLAHADFRGLSFVELKALVESQNENLFSRLFYMMIKLFHTTHSAEGFREEIGDYIQLQQNSFNTFKGRMDFLSDTAGALGLLGTVWGIFVTFFGGNVDNQVILSGMGIALITTLMGLIVSIILNLCSTEIFSVFNKRMDLLANKAETFRLRLMEIQQENQDVGLVDRISQSIKKTDKSEDVDNNQKPVEMRIVDGNGQTGVVMNKLRKPLMVSVVGKGGQKLKGVSVKFEVFDNSGTLNGEHLVREQKTDGQGKTSVSWFLGPKIGKQKVDVSVDGIEKITFVADAIAGAPSQLKIVNGNHQSGKINQELSEPLTVTLMDAHDNPVENHAITFEVQQGEGFLADNKKKITIQSDQYGQALASFTLGSSPGLNSIHATTKGIKESLEFQIMAQ